jgi:nucleotide-binding universal stress UspA family protein
MIRKILFATDLGAFTSHALLHVELLAKQFNARVALVHAVPPFGEFAAAVVKSHCSERVKREVLEKPHIKGLLESIREEIHERLMSPEFSDLNVAQWIEDIVVTPGNPAAVVLEQADWLRADMIVIGSHSAEALDGRLLGSVAAKILQLAKVPVLMVPMAKDPYGTGWSYPFARDDSSHFGT